MEIVRFWTHSHQFQDIFAGQREADWRKIVNFAGIKPTTYAMLIGRENEKAVITAAGVTASSDTHSIQSMLTMDALFL